MAEGPSRLTLQLQRHQGDSPTLMLTMFTLPIVSGVTQVTATHNAYTVLPISTSHMVERMMWLFTLEEGITRRWQKQHQEQIPCFLSQALNIIKCDWSEVFLVKICLEHNLLFQTSDHVMKSFHPMFPGSKIAKKFFCRHTNIAYSSCHQGSLNRHPIILRKHSVIYSKLFSVLIDESNNKTNNSCIVLFVLHLHYDKELWYICTRFLDMPVDNLANASNLFAALKESLESNGLDFNKCLSLTL